MHLPNHHSGSAHKLLRSYYFLDYATRVSTLMGPCYATRVSTLMAPRIGSMQLVWQAMLFQSVQPENTIGTTRFCADSRHQLSHAVSMHGPMATEAGQYSLYVSATQALLYTRLEVHSSKAAEAALRHVLVHRSRLGGARAVACKRETGRGKLGAVVARPELAVLAAQDDHGAASARRVPARAEPGVTCACKRSFV